MATLHVRNVPDPVYEWLRASAAANGRSIGAEAVVLLERLAGGSLGPELATGQVRRRSGPEHFSARGRSVIADAQAEAAELGARSLGPEHLLLALLRRPDSAAAVALSGAGLDFERVREAVEAAGGARSEDVSPERMPLTAEAKKALELALRECMSHHSTAISPEHLLVGIAGAGESVASRILGEQGLGAAALRQTLAAAEASREGTTLWSVFEGGHGFRVVELEGDAAEWERRLNAHAARGHQLVEIVDRRAIFRVGIAP